MKSILAIDPGSVKSAWVNLQDGNKILDCGIVDNSELIYWLPEYESAEFLAIEKPVCMKWSGSDVTETILWTGRFMQAWPKLYTIYTRAKIGWHILGDKSWSDKKIRSAIIRRMYPEYSLKDKGPLEGVKADIWQALAVALTAYDLKPWEG